jgi:hypothetical protein
MLASAGSDVVTIERERPINSKRRRVAPSVSANGRSKYAPHTGAKEQERAKRCYMVHFHPAWPHAESYDERLFVRSAPVMCQMSKRSFGDLRGA